MESKSSGSGVGETKEQLIDVKDVAERLGVCTASVWRLRDGGKMPEPVRVGRSVRWRALVIDRWIQDGCPVLAKFRRTR